MSQFTSLLGITPGNWNVTFTFRDFKGTLKATQISTYFTAIITALIFIQNIQPNRQNRSHSCVLIPLPNRKNAKTELLMPFN